MLSQRGSGPSACSRRPLRRPGAGRVSNPGRDGRWPSRAGPSGVRPLAVVRLVLAARATLATTLRHFASVWVVDGLDLTPARPASRLLPRSAACGVISAPGSGGGVWLCCTDRRRDRLRRRCLQALADNGFARVRRDVRLRVTTRRAHRGATSLASGRGGHGTRRPGGVGGRVETVDRRLITQPCGVSVCGE